MKLAIMQPYFLPYIGYFQLIAAVDCFVVYDNIKYTKKGWINRNRMLLNGDADVFTVPLQYAPDSFDIAQRSLAHDFDKRKLLNRFREAYRRAPYFASAWPLLEQVVMNDDNSLFNYVHGAIIAVCSWLRIESKIVVSSQIDIDHNLRSGNKVQAICRALGANRYLNPVGGKELYSKDEFLENGIELSFLQTDSIEYRQFDQPFVPSLSIIDVMMFNSADRIRQMLTMWSSV